MDGIKCVKVNLPRNIKQLEIIPISDTHIGDAACDYDLLKSRINYIKEHKNCYTILTGDIMNMAIKTSVSDIYSEKIDPMMQIEKMTELFEPINNKILGIVQGNHEARVYRNDGIDITKLVANNLKCLDKYSQTSLVLFIRFGEETRGRKQTGTDDIRQVLYTIYATHGSGGGRTTGAKANALNRLGDITNADIMIHSHTHMPIAFKEDKFEIDARNNCLIRKERLYVNTGAGLDYSGYAITASFKPASKSTPTIILSGERKEMTARL